MMTLRPGRRLNKGANRGYYVEEADEGRIDWGCFKFPIDLSIAR